MAAIRASRLQLAALDSNVLLHLAEEYAPAHNLVRRLLKQAVTTVVTQTVIQELAFFAAGNGEINQQRSSTIALQNLTSWGIQPSALMPVGNGICEIAANVIFNRSLLPEGERHDAFILLECGFIGASMLFTWDGDLLGADNGKLNEVLSSFDLHTVQIVHPSVILGYPA